MKRWLLVALALLVGVAVISNTTWRKRKQTRAILDDRLEDYVAASRSSRYIDIGVELRVVVADPNGEELISGGPRLRILRCSEHGGVLDTKANPPRLVAPSLAPRIWYCSEDQFEVIVHGDELPLGLLVYGSEGAGKTELMPMWHYFRWLEHLGERREGGQTAPTKRRLKMFRDAFFRSWPKAWIKKYEKSSGLIRLCDGSRIQLVSTHQQSKDAGSPIQGFNWSWCGSDEFQDSYERADDIEARGRSAKHARYKQARPCTAKDTTAWREAKTRLLAAIDAISKRPLWTLRKLLGRRSPFVTQAFWDAKRAMYSPREYARRIEPLDDLPPELAVYYGWNRERNLVSRPRITKDVTPALLRDYPSYLAKTGRTTLLVAHDPGNIWNTSVALQLLMFGEVPTWCVVGELQTKQTTAHAHARALLVYLREHFGVNTTDPAGDRAVVFIDPHGRGEGMTDYQTHYMAFQAEGLDAFNPAPMSKVIKRSSRVEMINRLLFDANSCVRLVVGCDERGNTLAPRLVEAFESLVKRPGDDDPEGFRRKDEDDKTHAPAALAYALWPFEQEAFTLDTQRRALIAAGVGPRR